MTKPDKVKCEICGEMVDIRGMAGHMRRLDHQKSEQNPEPNKPEDISKVEPEPEIKVEPKPEPIKEPENDGKPFRFFD